MSIGMSGRENRVGCVDDDIESGCLMREEGCWRKKAAPPAPAPAPAKVDKEREEEKLAYRYLLEMLEVAEDKSVSRGAKFLMTVELVVVLGLTAALTCTLTLEDMKHSRLKGLRMWQYVMMAITLFAGLSIIRCLTMILFYFLININTRLGIHRDVGYFLREMKRSIDVTVWFSGVLFLWYVWFRRRVRHLHGDISEVASHQLTRFLIAACLGAVLWVGKNALFFWLEADLHYRKLGDRITRTIRQLHVLQMIHNLGNWVFLHPARGHDDPNANVEGCDDPNANVEGYNICKELLLVRRERVPVWILRRLCEEYKHQMRTVPLPIGGIEKMQDPEKLMDHAVNLFREMKGKNPPDTKCPHSDVDEVSFAQVLAAGYKVNPEDLKLFFRSLKGEIVKPDIKPPPTLQHRQSISSSISNAIYGNSRRPRKTTKAAAVKTETDDVTIGRDEFVSWAVVAYRNCLGLQSTLKSSEEIIVKLNRLMIVFVLILALIIWLLLSEIVDTAQIALLFSPLIAVKFIFSESTKNMFDGLIFALAMHPFSPGDRVVINKMELLVTEISILTTTFYNYQTGEELVYPNSVLATIEIINMENNPDQSDQLEFSIDKSTALEDIRDLEIRIEMSLDERVDAFKTKVVKAEMGLETIKMIVHFNYVGSYLTSKQKAFHKSEMLSTVMHLSKPFKPKPKEDPKPGQEKVEDLKPDQEKAETSMPQEKDRVSKPYIVDIFVARRVETEKHLNFIKDAVTESVNKEGWPYDKDFKAVFSSVTKDKVRVIFWVWKADQQQISVDKLDEHCHSIYRHLLQKKSCLKVTQVKVQPTACSVEITVDGGVDMTNVKTGIERYLRENHYPYDFEVIKADGEPSSYDIHAWIQYPHNMEEKQQFDMEQIMEDAVIDQPKLEELKRKLKIKTITVKPRPQFSISTNTTNASRT